MCGLFAYFDPSNASHRPFEVEPVLAALRRRGPDGEGFEHFPGCSLLHTRLAVLDPERGQQPMRHAQSGLVIVYNGEIYNAPELRKTLTSLGHQFRTSTDTEVVLASFAEYGEACVAMFEGMFAFAIWDPHQQCLHIARDRMGEKPLFLARLSNGRMIVASEIKAILAAKLEVSLNLEAFDHYLQWKHAPVDKTIYNEIEVVPPAHTMSFCGTSIRSQRYWRLPPSGTARMSRERAVEELHDLLTTSVRNSLRSDRRVGIFLSGGIDSTLLGSLAVTATDRKLSAYTASYRGELDEAPRAGQSASILGMDHTTLSVDTITSGDLEAICGYLDQPHADSANLAQAMLSRRASKDVSVVISGDGADELFWGYRWYQQATTLQDRLDQMTIFPRDTRRKLLSCCQSVSIGDPQLCDDPRDGINKHDLSHYLGGQLLPKADLLGMMYGIEMRAPFLNHRIVEYAYALPAELKTGPAGKPLLRDLQRKIFPALHPAVDKQGFGAPLVQWLSDPRFGKYVKERLSHGAYIRNILESDELDRQIAKAFNQLTRLSAYRIWVLLCFELWAASWWTSR